MFNDKKLERIEALEEEVKEQKLELERTLSMFNSLLKRCNHLSEQNAQLKKTTAEDRRYFERNIASIDRVLEKHAFRIHTTYNHVFPKVAEFNIELERVFDPPKTTSPKS